MDISLAISGYAITMAKWWRNVPYLQPQLMKSKWEVEVFKLMEFKMDFFLFLYHFREVVEHARFELGW